MSLPSYSKKLIITSCTFDWNRKFESFKEEVLLTKSSFLSHQEMGFKISIPSVALLED